MVMQRFSDSDSDSDFSEYSPLLGRADISPVNWAETWTYARLYIIPATVRLRLLAIFSLLCELLHRVTGLIPGFSIDIYEHLLQLSLGFHLKRKTGEIASIMDRGIDSIDMIAHTVLFSVFPTIVEAAIVTALFIRMGTPAIAFTVLVAVTGYFAFTIIITQWRNAYRREMNEVENKTNDMAIDTLMNYETVKTFGKERSEVEAFTKLENKFRGLFIWYRISFNVLNFGQEALLNGGLGTVLVLAVLRAFFNNFSAGDVVLVLMYTHQVFGPLLTLGHSYKILSEAATDLEKCISLLKAKPTVTDAPNAISLPRSNPNSPFHEQGEITFQNVSFTYTSDRDNAGGLKGINFHIKPGQMVAFVGASGTGKSTIMRLLLRLYDVDEGAVLVNGIDVRGVTQESLRGRIGVVAQDTLLFNQTLRYNIGYGKEGASDAEIYAAVRWAALGQFVESLSEGLDTVVGERGVRLSGGEKQRVGIARCIIRQPSIILLDEASSALDTLTEREMQRNMREVCRGRTTVVIAHRLSTVMMADEIMVLGKEEGGGGENRILERGRHGELLARGGVYARMWEAQNGAEWEGKAGGETFH